MSDKATRDSFGEALKKLGAEFPNIVVLDADLSCSTKSATFAKAFPDRFFQMGIAESNMIGTAAGMSFTGLIPFACSFGAFVATRYETIRVSVGYSRANVKIVGTHAGLGIGEDGYTQMGLEDVNVLRGLPGITILQPSDDVTTQAAVRFAATHVGPVYLRLTRQKLPALYRNENIFQCGRGIILKEGAGLALIGSGSTVSEALKASEELSGLKPVGHRYAYDQASIDRGADQIPFAFLQGDRHRGGSQRGRGARHCGGRSPRGGRLQRKTSPPRSPRHLRRIGPAGRALRQVRYICPQDRKPGEGTSELRYQPAKQGMI